MSDLIHVVAQQFYGNRTMTELYPDEIDWFILGWIGKDGIEQGKRLGDEENIAREVIEIPNTDYVLVYNPVMEDIDKDCNNKPVAIIPELGLEIYSRCLICGKDKNGNFASLTSSDYEKVKKYLAE